MRDRVWIGCAVLSGLLAGSPIAAAAVPDGAGFSAERFRLSIDRDGLLDLEWAGVPRDGSWDVSLWLGYADDPVIVYVESTGNRTREGRLVDTRIGGSLSLAVAFFDFLEIGLDLPFIVKQTAGARPAGVTEARWTSLTESSGFTLTNPRIVPKIGLLRQDRHGLSLAILPVFILPSASNGPFVGQENLQFEPTVAVARAFTAWRLGANLGFRVRKNQDLLNLAVSDEIFGTFGLGFRPPGSRVELQGALSVATSLSEPFGPSDVNHVELHGGPAIDIAGPFMLFGALGAGLSPGFGTPDFRALIGLRFADHGIDSDEDGVPDSDDQCPKDAEDKDGFQDGDGCPDLDDDEDGIPDGQDGAPRDPEDKDGFQDEDGVPDHDDDGDGVMDWDDRCPRMAGPVENLGCPDGDRDNDGIVDRLDECPDVPEDRDVFQDTDGCPDPDDDGDGVDDLNDRCRLVPGPAENGGCPDVDRDGDGVVDRLDNCPDEPGDPARQGCKAKQMVQIQADRIMILDRVYFDTGRARIQSRSFKLLDDVAKVLVSHPELESIEVEGHTDSQGGDDTNLKLSQARAEAVRDYLVKGGVEAKRLTAVGYGEAKPIAPNLTAAGRAQNRRVEFRIKR